MIKGANIALDTIGCGSLLHSGGFAAYTTQATTTACASAFPLQFMVEKSLVKVL